MAKEKSTVQLLDDQTKVVVTLKGEQNETVYVNGHAYEIEHGKEVEVPETVANILTDAGLI